MPELATTALKRAIKNSKRTAHKIARHAKAVRCPAPASMFPKVATPAVRPPGRLSEKIYDAVRTVMCRDHRFRRLKLSPDEREFAAYLLNAMIEAHPSVHAQMIHPTHGQFDSNAGEAARSFIRSFAARHKISGVAYDKAFYR